MIGKLAGLVAAAMVAVLSLPAQAQAPAGAAPAAAPAQQPGVAVRVRGTVDSLNGNVLAFTTREGEKINITLADGWRVNAAIPLTLDDITNNAYIGVAAEEDANGNLLALDVRVFPEANRGLGEGFRPWDLTPKSTMTNATVAGVQTEANGARLVRVTYPNGEKMVLISPDLPIWTTEAGDASLVVPGAYAVISTRKLDDGTYTATTITIEKNGTRPGN